MWCIGRFLHRKDEMYTDGGGGEGEGFDDKRKYVICTVMKLVSICSWTHPI